MSLFIKLVMLYFVPPSWQHLTHPIDYCSMAANCVHDGQLVCGSSDDGCSRRSFLDQCDLYEYNCDFGTHFKPFSCEGSCTCTITTTTTHMASAEKEIIETQRADNGLIEAETKRILLKKLNRNICSPQCPIPYTWATTVEGESRDFYRILRDKRFQ